VLFDFLFDLAHGIILVKGQMNGFKLTTPAIVWCFWNAFAWRNQVDELLFFSMDETCAHVHGFVHSERKPMFVKMSQHIDVAQVKLKAENV
jgi:hypothetical protein